MNMGRVFSRALAAAGLSDLQARVLSGQPLSQAELARLEAADLLLVAGLADAMRAQVHGDEVQVLRGNQANQASRERDVCVFEGAISEHGATGAELLRELALLRLRTPARTRIAISMETLGIELAQTALLFGADTLIGDLNSARTLPLLDGAGARRRELEGLVARSGRRLRFGDVPEQAEKQMEQQL
jgi:2-iminoacetate synthase ThiH